MNVIPLTNVCLILDSKEFEQYWSYLNLYIFCYQFDLCKQTNIQWVIFEAYCTSNVYSISLNQQEYQQVTRKKIKLNTLFLQRMAGASFLFYRSVMQCKHFIYA